MNYRFKYSFFLILSAFSLSSVYASAEEYLRSEGSRSLPATLSSGSSSESLSEEERALQEVFISSAGNAGDIKKILTSVEGQYACVWDCDETLVIPLYEDYPDLRSTEMLREYGDLWDQVGVTLAQESAAYADMAKPRAFATDCWKRVQTPFTWKPVDEDLKDLIGSLQENNIDMAVCTGMPPYPAKTYQVHNLIGYRFGSQYKRDNEVFSLFYEHEYRSGSTTEKVPGWLYVNNGQHETKTLKLYKYWQKSNQDREAAELMPNTHLVFIDNNLRTLKSVRKGFKALKDDGYEISVLILIHSTKAATDIRADFESGGRPERMIEQYKRLVLQ